MIVATRGAGFGALNELLEEPTNSGSMFAVSSVATATEDEADEEENPASVGPTA
jgi:hypothetical protein